MATYAIGDVQGCYRELVALLKVVEFDRERDRLWFVGDLVNRGPQSLEVLRFVFELGRCATTVLGNHDLHLLAAAAGTRPSKRKDTFDDVLDAPDRDPLLDWLRHRSLFYHDESVGFAMLHAGLPPQWTIAHASARAAEVESVLRSDRHPELFRNMYGDRPDRWTDRLEGWDRLRFVINALTRMRYVAADAGLDLHETGPPGTQGPGLIPWFEASRRSSRGTPIVFGHWATLQLHEPISARHEVFHLDTGCVWGGRLSALRLDDRRSFSVPSSMPLARE